jgi:hypothetical protein
VGCLLWVRPAASTRRAFLALQATAQTVCDNSQLVTSLWFCLLRLNAVIVALLQARALIYEISGEHAMAHLLAAPAPAAAGGHSPCCATDLE